MEGEDTVILTPEEKDRILGEEESKSESEEEKEDD